MCTCVNACDIRILPITPSFSSTIRKYNNSYVKTITSSSLDSHHAHTIELFIHVYITSVYVSEARETRHGLNFAISVRNFICGFVDVIFFCLFPTFFLVFFFFFVENETNQRVTKDASKLARKRRRWEWDTMIHTHSQAVKHKKRRNGQLRKTVQ
jgi:hypothetical protein